MVREPSFPPQLRLSVHILIRNVCANKLCGTYDWKFLYGVILPQKDTLGL